MYCWFVCFGCCLLVASPHVSLYLGRAWPSHIPLIVSSAVPSYLAYLAYRGIRFPTTPTLPANPHHNQTIPHYTRSRMILKHQANQSITAGRKPPTRTTIRLQKSPQIATISTGANHDRKNRLEEFCVQYSCPQGLFTQRPIVLSTKRKTARHVKARRKCNELPTSNGALLVDFKCPAKNLAKGQRIHWWLSPGIPESIPMGICFCPHSQHRAIVYT